MGVTASDVPLVERAVRERWPVSEALRAEIIEALRAMIADPKATARTKAAAIRTILQADRISAEDRRFADQREAIERLKRLEEWQKQQDSDHESDE